MYLLQHIGAGVILMLAGIAMLREPRLRRSHGLAVEFVGIAVFAEGLLAAVLFFLAYWQAFWHWP